MSRRFSANNDEVRYPVQAGSNFTGAWSMAVLMKRASATNQWQAVIGHHDSSGNYATGFEIAALVPHAVAAFNQAATQYSTTTFQSSDGWGVLGVSRAAGTTTPRIHIFKGGVWTHENAGGAFADPNSQASGSIRLGELADGDDLDSWIAADAGWASDIGDAGFNALTTTLDLANWVGHATPPAYVHQHNQATSSEDILDLMGNGHVATGGISGTTDAVGIAGTSMDTGNEPTGWAYYGASAAPAAVSSLDPQVQWSDDFGPGEDFGPDPFAAEDIAPRTAQATQLEASGASAVTFAGSGAATARLVASGASAITVTATGAATVKGEASGTSPVAFAATGAATAKAEASGASAVTFTAAGSAAAKWQATGSSAVVFAATGTATVPGTVVASGTASISFAATGAYTVKVNSTGTAAITTTATGAGSVTLLPVGSAVITFGATGAVVFGGVTPTQPGRVNPRSKSGAVNPSRSAEGKATGHDDDTSLLLRR